MARVNALLSVRMEEIFPQWLRNEGGEGMRRLGRNYYFIN